MDSRGVDNVLTKLTCLYALATITLGAAPGPSGQEAKKARTLEPAKVVVTVEEAAPATVIYVEHTGPYWTVRGKLREVVDYMRRHDLTGQAYVRYAGDPTGAQAARTASEVGFITTADHDPEPPFKKAERPGEWLASMSVECSGSIAPHYYRMLRDWIESNGYRPLGPVMERYSEDFGSRDDGRSGYTVVLQMPIEPPPKPKEPAPADAPVDASKPAPTVAQAPDAVPTQPATVSTTGPAVPEPQPTSPPRFVDDGSNMMAELLDAGHVDAIVLRLMPDGAPIPAEMDLWLGQVVFRVSAVAKGIERTYPGEGGNVSALAAAIKEGYRRASADRAGSALDQVVVRVDPHETKGAQERRAIVQNLDRLLARIASRSVDAHGAATALAAALEDVAAVLKSARQTANRGG